MPESSDANEIPLRCPSCRVPRFLVGVTPGTAGRIRVPCTKCRKSTVFDLATGDVVDEQLVRADERELRCGRCRWFLAGVIATAAGEVRIPCAARHDPTCKHNNTFKVAPTHTSAVQVPVV